MYCDGACSGNPGPGGWAAITGTREQMDMMVGYDITVGNEGYTTNQRMELMAALGGLNALDVKLERCINEHEVVIVTDSAYLCNCFNAGWWRTWEKNGWRNASKQPVANQDLWQPLIVYFKSVEMSIEKVKGHMGDPLNEKVDDLAVLQSHIAKSIVEGR